MAPIVKHRIAAGVLVVHEERVLLVRHRRDGAYDFWVAPGGGAEPGEDLLEAARREAREETGIRVEPLRIAYIEDLVSEHIRELKVWFTARYVAGDLDATANEAVREHIVDARFMTRAELAGKTVYPSVLAGDFWQDLAAGFPQPRYLGLRSMEF